MRAQGPKSVNVAAKMSRLQASVRDLYHAHPGGGLNTGLIFVPICGN